MVVFAFAHAALPPGGTLIVFDAMIDDDRRKNTMGLLMSLNLLNAPPGSFASPGADCRAWMKEAGFKGSRIEPLVGPDSMIVGIK